MTKQQRDIKLSILMMCITSLICAAIITIHSTLTGKMSEEIIISVGIGWVLMMILPARMYITIPRAFRVANVTRYSQHYFIIEYKNAFGMWRIYDNSYGGEWRFIHSNEANSFIEYQNQYFTEKVDWFGDPI